MRIAVGMNLDRFVRRNVRRVADYLAPSAMNLVDYVLSEMEYVPQGWYPIAGWTDPNVATAQERHWPVLLRNLEGPGPLGVSHLPWKNSREDRASHNIMMSYGYVLARASRHKDKLTILDWGGGLGHYYLYSKALLPELELEYDCFEVSGLCRLGRKLQPGTIHLYEDEASLAGKHYDLVLSSSSLHYFENWREQLGKLADAAREFLYVSRLQSISVTPSFVALHKVYREGYPEFLSWCINRREFLDCAYQHGLELLREFVFTEPWRVRGAAEKPESRGFLLRRSRGHGQ